MKPVVAALAALALAGCGGDEVRGDLLLRADRLFDGERTIEPGAVLIRGDEIVAVGAELDAEAERAIDLGDATILPGFIDLHVHGEFGLLDAGVTTVRNLGAPLSALQPPGRHRGVRILRAGPIVTAPDGYPIPLFGDTFALEVRGERRAREAVRDLARRGVAVIKIALERGNGWPVLNADEVRAIVDEAHAHDLLVTAHVTAQFGAGLALGAGVDELAHMPCGAADDVFRRLARRGVEIVGTLHVLQKVAPPECFEPVADAARFLRAGGRLLYGADEAARPEAALDVVELRMMREAGMAPEQVLAAATSRAGEQIGLAPLGSLTEGAPADVIAVRGDARRLRDDLAEPLLVVAGGRIVRERRK